MSIEESETIDAARILKEFWEKGIYEQPAHEIKRLYDSLSEAIKKVEKDIKEDERSELVHVQANVPRLKEELRDLKSKRKIAEKRLQHFREEQRRLGNAYKEAEKLNQQGIELLHEIERRVDALKEFVDRHRAVRGEFERLRHAWEWNNWDREKPPEAPQLTLQSPQDVIKRKLREII